MGTEFYKSWKLNISFRFILGRLQFLVFFFLFLASYFSGNAQTSTLSFTSIPISNTDLIAPGRGAEQWIGAPWDNNYEPYIPAGNSNPLNKYYRFNWIDIESSTVQDSYNWTMFDNQINAAIDAGRMFSFSVMPMCTACGLPAYGYPTYLHNLMQAEGGNNTDWYYSAGGFWVPNWNSPNYLGRYKALLNAIASHIATGTHSGKNYKDVIYYVDIRGYGDFGEWHTYPWTGTEPTGRTATSASLKAIIDMNLAAFPNYPNVIIMGAYDGGNASQIPADVTYYALTATNNWGQIGWRRDNWGDAGYDGSLANNSGSYNPGSGSVSFAPLIVNKYKYAPVVGEPSADGTAVSRNCGSNYCDLTREITLYGATSFGNGNYPAPASSNPTMVANLISASKASGYRLVLTGGSMTTTLASGTNFNITLNWQNIGISPVYENWNVVYELRNSSGGVVWTGNSSFKPKFFLPQSSSTAASDNFTLSSSVAAGTYSMFLIIRDPLNYKKPLPLAITGVNADGSYLIRSNITVGTGTGNQAPTANAGINQTIQLPTSTATLTGTGTDPDGTISSYAWTKVSGPSGGTIASPSSANTGISGLAQGIYVYNLTVTDNLGATGSATTQITVNAATTSGTPPPTGTFTVNAGADQSLAAGTTTTTLNGTIPASSTGTSADTAILIVLQGESNASGLALNSSALSSEVGARNSVQILNHNTNQFESLNIGVNNEQDDDGIDATHHGLELGLANAANAGILRNPTYLVKIGAAGSYMCQWLKGTGINCRPQGGLWEIFIPYVDSAVARMKSLGKPFKIVVWQTIGLNDRYQVGTTPSSFMSMMAQFRSDFRARFGANIPFLATDFNNPTAQTYDWTVYFTQMAAADPNFHSIPVTGATYVDGGVHFDYAGFKLIANNMVNTMLTLGDGPSSGTGTGTTYTSTWSKVSGPTGNTIASPSTASTGVSGLTAGTYLFQLSVKDNLGTTVSDTMQVTVPTAANKPPVANAGIDQSITLPTNSVTLNGSASNDTDGSIASYLWTKISGPAQFTIGSSGTASTTLSNLAAGLYSLQLKVTDNLGATGFDTVNIIVNSAPANQPPIANAGADQTITLPVNSVTIDGSGSSDPDGSISTYLWTKISGPAQFTIGNTSSASTLVSNLTAGLYTFQLKVTDNGGAIALDTVKVNVNSAPANQLPVANAGGDITITLPTNVANLDGSASSDPDGTISSYSWNQVSGPATATISSPTNATTGLSGLLQGVYVFSLKVTDNSGGTDLDSIKVTVDPAPNEPPVANAGSSSTITLPVNTINLDGSLSSDPDGSIVSYSWIEISGPSAATLNGASASVATASNLIAGLYTFELTVTDNQGASAKADVKITVASSTTQPPVANAGADQTITLPTNSVTIDGSSSSASSGDSIISYVWSEKSGPSVVSLNNTAQDALTNLQAGVYVFSLTVTDNNGASASDSVTITVNKAKNKKPVASAGSSKNLTLSKTLSNTASTTLDGTASYDPDGTIVSYNWTQVSGPTTTTLSISGANTPILNLSGLVAGQYIYQLTVTDNSGDTSSAQTKVIVLAAPNIIPVANAGTNQSITAPANSVNLNGSASYDPDGLITAYTWATVSGPGAVTISNSNTATPSVVGLLTGVYIFQLTVTDNSGATAMDQVTIIVNPTQVLPNQAPVANAGTNQTITEPDNSISLNGTSSFDPDGTITAYSWTQISGPSASVISAGNTATPTVSQLTVGQYTIQLTVTDNNGTKNSDQITITVNPTVGKVNLPPVADAGKSDTISLPNNTYTLDASNSTDPDGTIQTYQWQQIGGPNTVSNVSMNNAQVTVSNLQAGEYEFQVTVTDNSGATSTAAMKLTVVDGASSVTDRLVIYPNPVHDIATGSITSAVTGTVKINVYDMNGKLVLVTEVEKTDNVVLKTFDVNLLASGMYTVQINIANRKTMVAKFIKY